LKARILKGEGGKRGEFLFGLGERRRSSRKAREEKERGGFKGKETPVTMSVK